MIPYARPDRNKTLLQNLLPPRIKETKASQGYFALLGQVPVLMSILASSYSKGLLDDQQIKQAVNDLDALVDFYRDLSRRQAKLVGEGVSIPRNMSDGGLKAELDMSFEQLCRYLDSMAEILFRLRNKGHIGQEQYQWMVRYFDSLRQLHREVYNYLS
jgi:hypothetical protein